MTNNNWLLQHRRAVWAGLGCLTLGLLIVGGLALIGPSGPTFPDLSGAACVRVFVDKNGNGQLDSGDQWLDDLPGAEVTVIDPHGTNGGTFALSRCRIRPQPQTRSVQLNIVLPAGYRATTPLEQSVEAYAPVNFTDYPPTALLGVQPVSPP